MSGREMKKVRYTPGLTDALREKVRSSANSMSGQKRHIPGKPIRVPISVIADQVSASMAIEGRGLVSKLTVGQTVASKKLVNDVVARAAAGRGRSRDVL
jgi:hypothetical protein